MYLVIEVFQTKVALFCCCLVRRKVPLLIYIYICIYTYLFIYMNSGGTLKLHF